MSATSPSLLPPGLAAFDFLKLDDLLTDDERQIQHTVRAWVREKAQPLFRDHYRAGTFPRELVADLARLGLIGATLKTHGCAGIGEVAYGLVAQELEWADTGLRSFASVTNGLVMYPIATFGSEAQKDRWLPALRDGTAIGFFGLTEPEGGSDPAAMRTRAVWDGDGYILNGAKMWITNGSIGDVGVVFAKVTGPDGATVIRPLLVERGMPGFTATDLHGKLSLRASVTSALAFENVRIPVANLLPGAAGLKTALMCLNKARYSIVWGAIGAALACFEETLAYTQSRVLFGKPIAATQLVQADFAKIWTDITHAQLIALRLGRLMEQGQASPQAVSLAKRANVRMALETARTCRELLGGAGILDDHVTMRHLCNLETVVTYEGTETVHTLVLGQALTGHAAF
jgi:glutaryl-CoA dehydrogenase